MAGAWSKYKKKREQGAGAGGMTSTSRWAAYKQSESYQASTVQREQIAQRQRERTALTANDLTQPQMGEAPLTAQQLVEQTRDRPEGFGQQRNRISAARSFGEIGPDASATQIQRSYDWNRVQLDKAKSDLQQARKMVDGLSMYAGGFADGSLRDWEDRLADAQARVEQYSLAGTGLAGQYYLTENREQRDKLRADDELRGQYDAIRQMEQDVEAIRQVISHSVNYDGGPEATAKEAYLVEKYGLTPGVSALGNLEKELEKRRETAIEALAEQGYDYKRMAGYEQMEQDKARYEEKQKEWAAYAREHPVQASARTLVTAPLQGIDYIQTVVGGLNNSSTKDLKNYVPANVYNMDATNFVQTIRGTVSEELEKNTDWELFGQNVASFLYNTGMSVGDSALQVATLGPAATVFMGSAAASGQAKDIIQRGGTTRQAFWGGLAAGAAEAVFEKFSVDRLLTPGDVGSFKAILKETAKQMGTEASEEMLTEVANILADAAIMGRGSQYHAAVREYQRQGLDRKEAERKAYLDGIGQVLWAGVGGALSGAAMGGPVSAANYVAQRGQTTDTPKSELVSGETDAGAETVPPTTAPVQEGRPQVTDGMDTTPPPQPAEAQKNASTGEAEYRATKPQNVELPTVPIISVSMDDVAVLNGGTMPEKGNYVRKAAFDDAVRRLGLDQNEAAYIEANNITRNGDAYVLKITKTALNKMLSASSYEDGTVPLETIAILKQIERVAQNGVWYESEGDRNGRDQIAGYDRLKTTVYIDNVPYAVDIRVRVEDQSVGGENRLYYFTPDSIRITKETDTGLRRARFHKRTMEGASVSNPTLSQKPSGGNPQSAPMEAEHEQTEGGVSAYGSETGDGVRDGGGGRLYGTSAGEQGGGLEQGAGQRQAAADQQRKAVERQNRVRASGAPVSTASLGIRSGSEAQTVRVIEEGLWDEEMRSTAQRVQQETGQRVRFVSGPLTLQTGVGERRVRGVWTDGGDILIQADHLRLSIDQIADHEMFHAKSQKEPKLIRLAREAVRAKYGEEELTRAVERYILNLEGVIDVPEEAGGDVWSNAYLDIMEELLADAYAGIDAWGTHADRFQDVVQQTVGEAGTGRSGETAVDTERTTGPPQQRFSIETGEDGIPYVNVNLDQRLFDDLTTSEMQNVAKKIISERFKGKVIGKNYTAYVNKRSAEHYAYPANRRMDEGQKRDKMRASTELDHLIEVSRYRGNEPDDGRHPDATGGLDKLDVRLAVNGRMYDAEITVLVTDHGRIFYDLTKMKDITRREIGQTQRAAETPRDVLADSSISQPEPKRNTKFSVDDEGEQPQFRRVETLPADRWVGDFVLGAKVSANGLGIPRGTEDRILQVVTGGESGEVRRAKKLIEKRGLRPVFFVGGDIITTGKSGQPLESWGMISDGVAYVRADHPEYTAREIAGQMLGLREVKDEKAQVEIQRTKPKKEKPKKEKVRKPVAESKPIMAKREFKQNLLTLFSIPPGMRAEVGKVVEYYADKILKEGKLTAEYRRALFDRLYTSGVMTVAADEYYQEGRQTLQNRKIYVSERDKAEIGGPAEWNAFRKRAFAAGIYLTNDKHDNHIDALNQELSSHLPGLFDPENLDNYSILERIIQVAEEGKDEKLSLAEYTARLAQESYIPEEQLLDSMERQLDWELRAFAEKAGLEVKLRDRTGLKLAQERADRRAQVQKQREAQGLRELQQKTLKQLNWLNKNKYRASEELQARFDEALGDIDLYAIGAANEMNWSRKHQATWKDLLEMYNDARESDPNFMPSKELERIRDRLTKAKLEDLSVDDLQDLYKLAVGLRTEFYNRNNVINNELGRMFSELYEDAKEEIRGVPGKFKGTVLDKLMNWSQLTPINAIQRMGGWNPKGALYSIARQLEQGERDMRAYMVKAERHLEKFLTEHEDWVKRADGQGEDAIWYEIEVPELLALKMGDKPIFGDTMKVYMTPAQKVHLYLESKSEDNLRHMMGGRTFADKELYSKGERREALAQGKTIRLAPETVKKLVSDLSPEELALAKALDGYYNEFAKKEINRISNILHGFDKAISAFYAPIYTNDSYNRTEFGVLDTKAENVGRLKGRIPYSKNPSLNISAFDAFGRHKDQTARFVGIAIPTQNWTNLLNRADGETSMKQIIKDRWGQEGLDYITNAIERLQTGVHKENDELSSAVDKLFGKHISAVFGANPSIVLKQLGSVAMAMPELGLSNVPSPARIRSIDRELISKYTQELAWRGMGYATPETKTLKENPNWTETNKVVKTIFGGGAITATDQAAASVLWPWAENKVRKEFPELEVGTQEDIDAGRSPFYQKVAKLFEEAVNRSQSMSDEMHQSTLRKSDKAMARAFTMFKSDAAQGYNQLRQKIGEAQYYQRSGADKETVRRAKIAAGEAVLGILASNAWAAGISFLVALAKHKEDRYRDDEDELTAGSVLTEMTGDLLGSLAGLVVGGSELAEVLGNLLTNEKWYGLDTPGMEQVEDLIDLLIQGGTAALELVQGWQEVGEQGGDVWAYLSDHTADIAGGVKELAQTVATYFFGVPVNNVEAYLLGLVSWASPELKTRYDDMWATVDKSGLSGLEGEALTARMESLLDKRVGGADPETAAELADLYEAGHKKAAPSDVPDSISVEGEQYKLDGYQKQLYQRVWSDTVAQWLDELVEVESYQSADQTAREKMLAKLYDYANQRARRELFEAYEPDKWVEELDEDAKRGESVAELIGWRVLAGGKYENFEGLTKAGLDEQTALTVTAALDELEPPSGKESVSALQKYQTIGNLTLTEREKGQALQALMSESAYGKYQTARGAGISTRAYCDFLAQIATYTGDRKQERVWAYINRLPISDRQKDALHYAAGYTESSLGKTPWH
jgi:hypothetical protein